MKKGKAVQLIVISTLLFFLTGCGRMAQSINDTPNSDVSVLSPQNLRALEGNNKIILVWDNPSDVDFNGVVVQRVDSNGTVQSKAMSSFANSSVANINDGYYLPPEGTALPENGLENGETYEYRVCAKDSLGNYSSVLVQSATPKASLDKVAPGVVGSIYAVNISDKVFLNWSKPSDSDCLGVIVVRREDRYPESINDGSTIYVGDKSAYTDDKVTQGKRYYYSLFAFDNSLNFSNSSTIVVNVNGTKENEFMVNTDWSSDQKSPATAALANGGFVVTALDKIVADDYNIVLNIFNSSGQKVISEKKLILTNVAESCIPKAADLKNGYFVLTWESNGDIFAQIFDYSGVAVTSEFRVNGVLYQTNDQSDQSVASLGDGKFVIAWETDGEDGNRKSVNYKIYSYASSSGLVTIKSDTRANQYTTHHQKDPSIAVLNDGNFVILWESRDSRYIGYDVAGSVFSSYGSPISKEFRVNNSSEYYQNDQKWINVAALNDGSFVVSWVSAIADAPSSTSLKVNGVFSRKCFFNGSGVVFSPVKKVNSTDLIEFEYSIDGDDYEMDFNTPQVLGLADGGYVVVWDSMDNLDGQGSSVRAQRFSVNNELLGSEYQINVNGRNDQRKPSLATLANGDVIFVWQSDQSKVGNQDIWGKFERL